MRYDIFSSVAPVMSNASKGTEFCKLLLSKASKDMQELLITMFLAIFVAHASGYEFQFPTSLGRNFVA